MKAKKEICVVLDLDDTLYHEYEYQQSGFLAVEEYCNLVYCVNVSGFLSQQSLAGETDVFSLLCKKLGLPEKCKDSFLWIYRNHYPDIRLSEEAREFIGFVQKSFSHIAIITDGRSVTQRLKLHSLELNHLPVFISEEWGECKPGFIRFEKVQAEFKADLYFYIGDNPKKDFLAPNKLGWTTVCLKDKGFNVHSQSVAGLSKEYFPDFWVDSFGEILSIF